MSEGMGNYGHWILLVLLILLVVLGIAALVKYLFKNNRGE